jgi:glycosyltransferase 2 family protein
VTASQRPKKRAGALPRHARLYSLLAWAASAVLVATLVRTLLHVDFAHALSLVRRAGIATIVIALPYPIAMAIDTFTGKLLLGTLGQKPRFRDLYWVRLACEAVLLSLPLGTAFAESLNLFLLYRHCHVAPTQGIAVTVGKRWLLLRAHGLYVVLSAVVGYGVLAAHSRALIHVNGLPWIVLASSLLPFGLAAAMAATFERGAVAAAFGTLLRRAPIPLIKRWSQRRSEGFTEADIALGRVIRQGPGPLRRYTALLLAAWLMDTVETLLILRVLGVPIGFVEVISFEAGLSLVRSLAFFVPAGLGVQDLGYLAFFTALGIPDALTVGTAFVLLKRTKELLWVAVGYTLLFVLRVKIERAPLERANSAAASSASS